MSSLWLTNRPAASALNRAVYRRRPTLEVGARVRIDGILVTVSKSLLPWGQSTHRTVRGVAHQVDRVFIAWQGGVPIGSQVRWLCGNTTTTFELAVEPQALVCRRCLSCGGRGTYP